MFWLPVYLYVATVVHSYSVLKIKYDDVYDDVAFLLISVES